MHECLLSQHVLVCSHQHPTSHLEAGRERWRRWGTPSSKQVLDTVQSEAEANCRIGHTQNEHNEHCKGTPCQPHRVFPLVTCQKSCCSQSELTVGTKAVNCTVLNRYSVLNGKPLF